MPGAEYVRFLESMKIGYVQWHDGEGYDLAALAAMPLEDRTEVEAMLAARLTGQADWRDVEALAAIGTPVAMTALKSAVRHRNPEVRNRVLEILAGSDPKAAADLGSDIENAVRNGALDLAQGHPTPGVKRALLDCARLADPVTRVHAAAMLMYLCGKADEPFDWKERPFFLRFGTEDMAELRAAWTELRERTGV
jgi:hypothetical protein